MFLPFKTGLNYIKISLLVLQAESLRYQIIFDLVLKPAYMINKFTLKFTIL